MANYTVIADEMTERFIYSKNKKYTLNKIVHDINNLVYSNSKEALSYKTKSAIFNHIFDVVAGRRTIALQDQYEITPDFSDILYFFERRSFLLNLLKAGASKRWQLN